MRARRFGEVKEALGVEVVVFPARVCVCELSSPVVVPGRRREVRSVNKR